jgi:DNA-binding CsgD family transcriptional regulator
VLRHPGFAYAYCLATTGEWDEAQRGFEELERRAALRGDESSVPTILNHLAYVQLVAGRWDEAARRLEEGVDRALETGQAPSLASILGKQALLAAWRGEASRATALAGRALATAVGNDFDAARPELAIGRGGESAIWALGHLALSGGAPAEACRLFLPVTRVLVDAGIVEPGELPWLADEAEALIMAGRLPEARLAVDRLEAWSVRLDRRPPRALAARCRGLLEAAEGRLDAARTALVGASAQCDALGLRFDGARARLALGSVQRRAREHRVARETLQRVSAEFEALGASIWTARARAELDRVGGRRPSTSGLSPTERQVAALAAAGKTNREVAAELFLSIHTVEAALTSIYGKVGVRSRTELARRDLST